MGFWIMNFLASPRAAEKNVSFTAGDYYFMEALTKVRAHEQLG